MTSEHATENNRYEIQKSWNDNLNEGCQRLNQKN